MKRILVVCFVLAVTAALLVAARGEHASAAYGGQTAAITDGPWAALIRSRLPVALWTFDDCAPGKATFKDLVGSHDAAISAGVTCTDLGRGRLAAHFDGSTGIATAADAPDLHLTSAVTLAATVRPDRTAYIGTIVSKWYAPDSYSLAVIDGQYWFSIAFPGGQFGTAFGVSAPAIAGQWAQVVGVFDGSTMSLYVNGALVASAAHSGVLQSSDRPIAIGNHPAWAAFAGDVDDVAIFNLALTGRQVAALYAVHRLVS